MHFISSELSAGVLGIVLVAHAAATTLHLRFCTAPFGVPAAAAAASRHQQLPKMERGVRAVGADVSLSSGRQSTSTSFFSFN